jgi:hypothetical protein
VPCSPGTLCRSHSAGFTSGHDGLAVCCCFCLINPRRVAPVPPGPGVVLGWRWPSRLVATATAKRLSNSLIRLRRQPRRKAYLPSRLSRGRFCYRYLSADLAQWRAQSSPAQCVQRIWGARPGKIPPRSDASRPRPLGSVNELVKYADIDAAQTRRLSRSPAVCCAPRALLRVCALRASSLPPPTLREHRHRGLARLAYAL